MAEDDLLKRTKGAQAPEALTDHDHGVVTGTSSISPVNNTSTGLQLDLLTGANNNGDHEARSVNGASSKHEPFQTKSNPNIEAGQFVLLPADEEARLNPHIEQVLPEDENNEEGPGEEQANQTNEGAGVGVGAKKKKKRKPKSQRGLNAPSGFEEYYVDVPLTPAEFEEEKSIYAASYPFAQRIETAIQRFVAKRNLDSARKKLFDRYLVHGGVEGGPKMFTGGLDAGALSDMNAAEIAELSATNYVRGDKGGPNDSVWVVDFEGCLRSFLSTRFPAQWDLTSEEMIKYHVNIIRNFLNYLLHHNVCPEYTSQINAARTLCDKAQKELWQVAQLLPLLPGDFNMACSIIFGGIYQGMYSSNLEWMEGDEQSVNGSMNPEHARKVFKFALAANANDDIFAKYREQLAEKTCHITGTEDAELEVTEIVLPNDETRGLYAQRQCSGLKIVGKMMAKTWFKPKAEDEDLTEEEEAALAARIPETKTYKFWIEEELLQKMFIGMKFETTITHLSFGVSYFDAITGVYCSFHKVMPNQLMEGWREPEKVWLPMRPKVADGFNVHEEFDEDFENAEPEGDLGGEQMAKENAPEQRAEGIPEASQLGPRHENDYENYFLTGKKVKKTVVEAETTNSKPDGALEESDLQNPGVELRKVGSEETKVSGNPDKVVEEIYDVVATD